MANDGPDTGSAENSSPSSDGPRTTPDDLQRSYAQLMRDAGWTEDAPPSTPKPATTTDESKTPPAPMRIIEALLFVGGEPLSATRAEAIVRGLKAEQFTEVIDELNHAYRRQNRPYTIQPKGDGYVLAVRPKHRGLLDKLYGGVREARLSTQAVDVLALVAYRQPATKAEIDSLRGAESGPLLRQLVRRGLIHVVYRADADRKEVSYGTTPRFLEVFGLQNLDDLPKTQELLC
jgi:segregation and condensation protein B